MENELREGVNELDDFTRLELKGLPQIVKKAYIVRDPAG